MAVCSEQTRDHCVREANDQPVTYKQFQARSQLVHREYRDGWTASHCHIRALSPAQAVVFDWLDRTVKNKDRVGVTDSLHSWDNTDLYEGLQTLKVLVAIQFDSM